MGSYDLRPTICHLEDLGMVHEASPDRRPSDPNHSPSTLRRMDGEGSGYSEIVVLTRSNHTAY